jgi:hypothetical protein
MSGEHGRGQDDQIKKDALGTSWKGAILDPMARPEGFEPPTPRSVVIYKTDSQSPIEKKGLVFLTSSDLLSIPVNVVFGHSGNDVETINVHYGIPIAWLPVGGSGTYSLPGVIG